MHFVALFGRVCAFTLTPINPIYITASVNKLIHRGEKDGKTKGTKRNL